MNFWNTLAEGKHLNRNFTEAKIKIVVLSGSPKGELSVALQYVKLIQRKLPQHELSIFNISHDIQIGLSSLYFPCAVTL